MKRFLASFAAAAMLLAGIAAPAQAGSDGDPVVIELFASQNCTACPKAHKTLKAVKAEHDDVLILTWSVDYWDYLGDPDPMAIPQAKTRQAAYTDRMALRAPYTPQSVYDGAKQCPATKREQVEENIIARLTAHEPDRPRIAQDGDQVVITGPAPKEALEIVVVHFLTAAEHQTAMTNPVTSSEVVAQWSGSAHPIDVSCAGSCAVLVQEAGFGEIRAALELARPS